MANKKQLTTALTAICSALDKGYKLLNEGGQLPEVAKEDLPAYGPHIIRALVVKISEAEENDKYEGMSYEEIISKKDAERHQGILRNLEQAAADFKKMKAVAEPVQEEDPGDDFESDEDLDQDDDQEFDEDLVDPADPLIEPEKNQEPEKQPVPEVNEPEKQQQPVVEPETK